MSAPTTPSSNTNRAWPSQNTAKAAIPATPPATASGGHHPASEPPSAMVAAQGG
jgi:hypothetical protein